MERSPFSDFVFANAMRAKNYIGIECECFFFHFIFLTLIAHSDFKHYYYVRKTAMPKLPFWPHLVVYIDAPVKNCLENIKKNGNVGFAIFFS